MNRERQLGERLFVIISAMLLAAWGLAQICYGERVPAGDGQGWDGRAYTWLIQDFDGVLSARKLDSYRVQRILPSLIVRGALTLGGIAAEPGHIVRAFALLNLAALLGTLILWNGICRAVSVGIAGRWLGFCLIFVNFACLKAPFYIPVMTDHSALFLGALLVYAHVSGRTALQVAALWLGAFTWPSFLVLGGMLLCFPRRRLSPEGQSGGRHWIAGGALGVGFVLGLRLHLWNPVPYYALGDFPIDAELLPISVALAIAYIVCGFGLLLRQRALFDVQTYREAVDRRLLAVWLVLWLLVQLSVASVASADAPPQTVMNFLRYQIVQPVIRPALPLLAHAVYLGLLPLLAVFYWPRACRAAHRLGLGFTLFTAALLAQSLTSVSRQLLHGLVAFALLVVLAVEGIRWPRWAPWLLGVVAAIGSKAWFAVNHQGFGSKSDPLSYPAQYYFMNLGLWMAPEMYALQGSVVLALSLLLALVRLRERRLGPEERRRVHPSSQKVLRASLASSAVLLATFAGEAAARRLLERQLARESEPALSRPDATLGWVNLPGSAGRIRFGGRDVLLRFNSRGLRGPEYDLAKPPGTRRVLLLGGSLAEAAVVPEASSFRAGLEARLGRLGCGAVEVINGGVARYGLEQQARFFSSEGSRYSPDLVIALFGHADLVEALRPPDGEGEEAEPGSRMPRRLRNPPRLPLYPWHDSAALRVLSNLTLERAPTLHRWLAATGLVERGKPPVDLWPFAIREESDRAWQEAAGLLETLAAEVRARGAAFVVVHGPALFEVDEHAWKALLDRHRMSPRFWRRERVARRLQAAAREAGAPLLDLRESFARARAGPASLYHSVDGAWTAAAHALAAEAVAPELVRLLGCPAGQPSGGASRLR